MEESMKGLIVTLTTVALFTTAILSFIIIFPQEQGVAFTDIESSNTYLIINNTKDLNIFNNLTSVSSNLSNAFNQWDITQGYMGSNTLKQSSNSNVQSYNTNIFSEIKLIATKLFGTNSPIVYAIGILFGLAGIYITLVIVRWIRQGQ